MQFHCFLDFGGPRLNPHTQMKLLAAHLKWGNWGAEPWLSGHWIADSPFLLVQEHTEKESAAVRDDPTKTQVDVDMTGEEHGLTAQTQEGQLGPPGCEASAASPQPSSSELEVEWGGASLIGAFGLRCAATHQFSCGAIVPLRNLWL